MRQVNQAGRDLIKHFEGLRLKAYQCSAGVWTIGWGSTRNVKPGEMITEAEAEIRFEQDLGVAAQHVVRLSQVVLTDNQFAALTSFVFNLGPGNLRDSTLLRKLNQRRYDAAAREFGKWTMCKGQMLPGLKKRRDAERLLFESGPGSRRVLG